VSCKASRVGSCGKWCYVFQRKVLYGYKRHFRTNDAMTSVTGQQAKLMAFAEFSEASIKTRVFITGPPNGLVLFCSLASVVIVCLRL